MQINTTTGQNPILSGFRPDPSICRIGEDYYLVNSTFSYFPGVPISHSKDLIHWETIGNVLTRKSQLDLTNSAHSGGIYAPTLRYHNGTYYMITTNIEHGGNFVVTAPDILGPWSDPYFLDTPGIDPSLFFDDDGRCYYCGTKGRREGEAFWGDNEIYVQELDLQTMKLVGESWVIWHSALRDAQWSEGPHIYKINGYYYVLIAEGGTGPDHAICIARSQDLHSYFEGNRKNPILTHRHLGMSYPIINTGHADLFQTSTGDWFMVLLASRPYDDRYCNLGRETFLVPVTWEGGWPVCNPGLGMVCSEVTSPHVPVILPEAKPLRAFGSMTELPPDMMYLRNPIQEDYCFTTSKGLTMRLSSACPGDTGANPSAVFLRQQNFSYDFSTEVSFQPTASNEEAGIVLMQSDHYLYRFALLQGNTEDTLLLCVIRCAGIAEGAKTANTKIIASASVPREEKLILKVTAQRQQLSFCCQYGANHNELMVAENVSATMLSTEVAGGFVGTCLGIYASSKGENTDNTASFTYICYEGKE